MPDDQGNPTATELVQKEAMSNLENIKAFIEASNDHFEQFIDALQELGDGDYNNTLALLDSIEDPPETDWEDLVDDQFDVDKPNTRSYTPSFGELPIPPNLSLPTVSIRAVDPGVVPTAPTMSLPDRPSPLNPRTFTPPTIDDINVPTAPSYTLPDDPDFIEIVIPPVPDLPAVPEFTTDAPVLDIPFPDQALQYQEPDYHDWHADFSLATEQMTEKHRELIRDTLSAAFPQLNLFNGSSLDVQISNMAKTGLSGLPPDVEQAIFNRAMTVVIDEARRNLEAVDDEFSAAGYPMPPGALRFKRDRIRAEVQDRIEDFKRTFIAKQTELVQANTRFLQEIAMKAEESDRTFFNAIYDRQLAVAKATFELAIAWYNMRITYFNAQLATWKTEAEIYELRIRASLQILERYKLQLEGEKLKGDLNMQQVQLYRAQLDGVLAVINIYTQQVETTKVLADLERLKLDTFKTTVEAYGVEVNAKRAEYEGYAAAAGAETAKATMYRAQVDGYNAQLQAKKTVLDADIAKLDGDLKIQTMRLEQYKEQIQAYLAKQASIEAYIRKYLGEYQAEIEAYKAEVGEAAERTRLQIQGLTIDAERWRTIAQQNTQRMIATIENIRAYAQMRQQAVTSGAAYTSAIAQSAASQLNAVTDMSAQFQTIE